MRGRRSLRHTCHVDDHNPAYSHPAAGIPRRVLVAEDSPAIGEMLVEVLSLQGHHVDLASDGRAALARIAEVRYDLVIADATLSGLDGFALYTALVRQRPELLERFVLITAGRPSAVPRLAVFRAETGVPVLEKPIQLAELTTVIQSLLARDIATPRVTFPCPFCLECGRELIIVAELDPTISFPVIGNLLGCVHAQRYGKIGGLTPDEERRLIAAALDAWEARSRE